MKVKELIEVLSELPPDEDVRYCDAVQMLIVGDVPTASDLAKVFENPKLVQAITPKYRFASPTGLMRPLGFNYDWKKGPK